MARQRDRKAKQKHLVPCSLQNMTFFEWQPAIWEEEKWVSNKQQAVFGRAIRGPRPGAIHKYNIVLVIKCNLMRSLSSLLLNRLVCWPLCLGGCYGASTANPHPLQTLSWMAFELHKWSASKQIKFSAVICDTMTMKFDREDVLNLIVLTANISKITKRKVLFLCYLVFLRKNKSSRRR